MKLQDEIQKLSRVIAALQTDPAHPNRPPRLHAVGGFVRDQMLGRESLDADLEVFGVPFETLESILLREYPDRVNVVGRSFAVFHLSLGEIGAMDISIPRRDSKSGEGHRDFVVQGDPWMDPLEAARRRDFTINAIAMDPLTGERIDPFHGARDLEEKALCVVDPKTFGDDPLRVYRGMQLVARFELTVEKETATILGRMVKTGTLTHLSTERITEEWRKLLLKAPTPSRGLEYLKDFGILSGYPELSALIATVQDPVWHPEGSVWIHTCMAIDEAATLVAQASNWTEDDRLLVMLGVLCHDMGKPVTTSKAAGRVHSAGHDEEAGEDATRSFLAHFNFGEQILRGCITLVHEHLRPRQLYAEFYQKQIDEQASARAIGRLLRRIAPVSWRVLLKVSEADLKGRLTDDKQTASQISDSIRNIIETYHLEETELQPLLQGRDLIELGISPGPEMGKLLEQVEAARDEGLIQTREEAIAYLKKIMVGRE